MKPAVHTSIRYVRMYACMLLLNGWYWIGIEMVYSPLSAQIQWLKLYNCRPQWDYVHAMKHFESKKETTLSEWVARATVYWKDDTYTHHTHHSSSSSSRLVMDRRDCMGAYGMHVCSCTHARSCCWFSTTNKPLNEHMQKRAEAYRGVCMCLWCFVYTTESSVRVNNSH